MTAAHVAAPARSVLSRAAALFIMTVALVVSCAGPLRAEGRVEVVGRLPVDSPKDRMAPSTWFVDDVNLVVNPLRRRGFLMFALADRYENGLTIPRIGIRTFDLDSLEELSYVTLDQEPQKRDVARDKGQWLFAHDQEAGRIYLASFVRRQVDGTNFHQLPGDVVVLDERRLEAGDEPVVARLRPPVETEGRLALRIIMGLSFVPESSGPGKLLLVYSAQGFAADSGSTPPLVAQMDAGTGAIDWMLDLQECFRGYPITPLRGWIPVWKSIDQSRIYTICNTSSALTAVVRLQVGEDGAPATGVTPRYFPGPSYAIEAFGDPISERMLVVTKGAGSGGRSLWVFDGTVSRYVGSLGLMQVNEALAFGIDTVNGRLYALTPHHVAVASAQDGDEIGGHTIPVQGGLLAVDFRLTPVPQAVNLLPTLAYPSQPTIVLDTGAGAAPRLFIRRANGSEPSYEKHELGNFDDMRTYPEGKIVPREDDDFYAIAEDRTPAAEEVPFSDVDRLTIDVPEGPHTSGTFDASGSAYGIRAHLVGGIGAALRAHEDGENILRQGGYMTPCWYTDRDVVAAWIRDTHLTDLQAEGQAASFRLDEQSRADADQTFSRCPPPRAPKDLAYESLDDLGDPLWELLGGSPWEREDVECAGTASTSGEDARTRCDFDHSFVEAEASWSGFSAAGVSVSYGWSQTTVRRDASKGVVVRAEALARGVQLEDISIELVHAAAESWSNGRPSKGARASLVRRICGVATPTFRQQGCDAGQRAIDEINAALAGRMEVRSPAADARFLRGSRRGYVAGVTKRLVDVEEDRLINRDYHAEVPGLRIIGYRDSAAFGPGRQVIELAGVRAVTTYGIQCLPPRAYDAGRAACVVPVGEAIPPLDPVPGPPVLEPEPTGPGDAAQVPEVPAPIAPPSLPRVVQQLLIRTVSEGLLAAGIWFMLGLPFLLAWRRGALTRTIGRGA